jgi:hypothetical protein
LLRTIGGDEVGDGNPLNRHAGERAVGDHDIAEIDIIEPAARKARIIDRAVGQIHIGEAAGLSFTELKCEPERSASVTANAWRVPWISSLAGMLSLV